MNQIAAHLLMVYGSLFAFQTAQLPEKGVPYLQNYTPAEYSHKGKIWDIDSAPNGMVYMASNAGLLEFDGQSWNSYTGSEGITRSIVAVNDSVIYTGSDLDFGVWKKNKYLEFEYTSLYPFREDLLEISEEFWSVHELNGNIFFVSANNIYVYSEGNLTKIGALNEIQNSFQYNNSVYFMDEQEGLYQLQDLTPRKIADLNSQDIPVVIGAYEDDDQLIIVTQNSGLYLLKNSLLSPIKNELSDDLKKANVFSFEKINNNHLAFGTILNGVIISDETGKILHRINKNKGLQNNTILSLHFDSYGHLWLSMDYGVSRLDFNTNFTFINDYRGNFGTGYSAILDGNIFYLGTNQGLYKTNWEDLNNNNSEFNTFKIIEDSEGQVWSLHTFDNQIWIAHDRGLFILKEGKLFRIGENRGIWTIQPYKNYLLVGTYNGISIYKKEGAEWIFWKKMELILGSCNQILIDEDERIWVNIPNYGVIKAELNDEMYPTEREIFLSEEFGANNHYLVVDEENIQVHTNSFLFNYSEHSNSFNKETKADLNTIVEDHLKGPAQPFKLNENYEFYPLYNGFALKDLNQEVKDQSVDYTVHFKNIEAYNNQASKQIFSGVKLTHSFNNIRIKAIVPNQRDIVYQFKTQNSDQWSNWFDSGVIELVGLDHGDYKIAVRALVNGKYTPEKSIHLVILPPWYLSWYAYTVYSLLGIALIWTIYYLQGVKLKKQKKALLIDQRKSLHNQEERYQEKIRHAEEAKIKAENDHLKEQLKSKTIELATKAKENEEKNRILKSLTKKLAGIEDNPENLNRKVKEIQKVIDSHINSDDDTFDIQIDELHKDLYSKLRAKFTDLTRYDLRLCAYIKLGFDSKEISNLLNIKPSSVYISRSRLRKKLNIESEEDLHSYLNSL